MIVKLKNIGIIECADIKINGITVIAGENDTGKSTISKILFSVIKSDNICWREKATNKRAREILALRLNLVFDANITQDGSIVFEDNHSNKILQAEIKDKNFVKTFIRNSSYNRLFDATFVSTPVIFDLLDFFNSVAKMRDRRFFDYGVDFDIKYPYLMWDLYDKLTKDNPFRGSRQQEKIQDMILKIIQGEFIIENGKMFYFKFIDDKLQKIEMFNTATGVKSFGILQMLNKNRFLNKKTLLIIDEPEVHLHPEWEIKMAKLIVELSKFDIKIIVNSHSPYIIQAINKFGKEEKLQEKMNFYLAKLTSKGKTVFENKNDDLNSIFTKLSKPLQEIVWG